MSGHKTVAVVGHRERTILELRFGLRDRRSASLQRDRQSIGVTGERIRPIEARALGKLRCWAHDQDHRVLLLDAR